MLSSLFDVYRRRLALSAGLAMVYCALTLWALCTPARALAQSVDATSKRETPALSQAEICGNVSAVPITECAALVELYTSTEGNQWRQHTNWLAMNSNSAPCNWFGVTCSGGHVTKLELPRNRLRGPLPPHLGVLSRLGTLLLPGNLLSGAVPISICDLVDTVQQAGFAYNELSATNRRIATCMERLDPGWAATQTTAPANLSVTAITTASVQLSWQPIRYTGDGGYYEIDFATTLTGPYTTQQAPTGKQATGYRLTGLQPGTTYFIRVRSYTPAHTGQPDDAASPYTNLVVTTQASGIVLVMIYFPADNDLSPYVDSILRRIQKGTAVNPNVRVVFLADKYGGHNTRVLEIAGGKVTLTTAVQDHWGVDELDTTDPQVLAWFLTAARARYPTAARTVVSLMGHGLGLMPEFDWLVSQTPGGEPQPQPGIPDLPKGIEATPGDVANAGGYMSTIDFGRALAAATDNGAHPFDVVFFDQCLQGNLDVLYQVHQAAKVLIASPNYAWLAAPYQQYLSVLTPTDTPEMMAEQITRLYERALTDAEPNAILWVHGADIPAIAQRVDALATALHGAVQAGKADAIWQAASKSQYVDTTQCGPQNLRLGPPDELLGAGSFATNLQIAFPSDPYGIHTAAGDLLAALDAVHHLYRIGRPYLDPSQVWAYTDSLTLLAPLPRDTPAAVAWRASIYTSTTPLTAIWSPLPSQTVLITTSFALRAPGHMGRVYRQLVYITHAADGRRVVPIHTARAGFRRRNGNARADLCGHGQRAKAGLE